MSTRSNAMTAAAKSPVSKAALPGALYGLGDQACTREQHGGEYSREISPQTA